VMKVELEQDCKQGDKGEIIEVDNLTADIMTREGLALRHQTKDNEKGGEK